MGADISRVPASTGGCSSAEFNPQCEGLPVHPEAAEGAGVEPSAPDIGAYRAVSSGSGAGPTSMLARTTPSEGVGSTGTSDSPSSAQLEEMLEGASTQEEKVRIASELAKSIGLTEQDLPENVQAALDESVDRVVDILKAVAAGDDSAFNAAREKLQIAAEKLDAIVLDKSIPSDVRYMVSKQREKLGKFLIWPKSDLLKELHSSRSQWTFREQMSVKELASRDPAKFKALLSKLMHIKVPRKKDGELIRILTEEDLGYKRYMGSSGNVFYKEPEVKTDAYYRAVEGAIRALKYFSAESGVDQKVLDEPIDLMGGSYNEGVFKLASEVSKGIYHTGTTAMKKHESMGLLLEALFFDIPIKEPVQAVSALARLIKGGDDGTSGMSESEKKYSEALAKCGEDKSGDVSEGLQYMMLGAIAPLAPGMAAAVSKKVAAGRTFMSLAKIRQLGKLRWIGKGAKKLGVGALEVLGFETGAARTGASMLLGGARGVGRKVVRATGCRSDKLMRYLDVLKRKGVSLDSLRLGKKKVKRPDAIGPEPAPKGERVPDEAPAPASLADGPVARGGEARVWDQPLKKYPLKSPNHSQAIPGSEGLYIRERAHPVSGGYYDMSGDAGNMVMLSKKGADYKPASAREVKALGDKMVRESVLRGPGSKIPDSVIIAPNAERFSLRCPNGKEIAMDRVTIVVKSGGMEKRIRLSVEASDASDPQRLQRVIHQFQSKLQDMRMGLIDPMDDVHVFGHESNSYGFDSSVLGFSPHKDKSVSLFSCSARESGDQVYHTFAHEAGHNLHQRLLDSGDFQSYANLKARVQAATVAGGDTAAKFYDGATGHGYYKSHWYERLAEAARVYSDPVKAAAMRSQDPYMTSILDNIMSGGGSGGSILPPAMAQELKSQLFYRTMIGVGVVGGGAGVGVGLGALATE